MRPTVHQKLKNQGDLAPELSEGWTGGRAQVNLKRLSPLSELSCRQRLQVKTQRPVVVWPKRDVARHTRAIHTE
jgi:hypothetical protein